MITCSINEISEWKWLGLGEEVNVNRKDRIDHDSSTTFQVDNN